MYKFETEYYDATVEDDGSLTIVSKRTGFNMHFRDQDHFNDYLKYVGDVVDLMKKQESK